MDQLAKNVKINLRGLTNAFITNIKSKSTGVEKRCVCIPIEDNFIDEQGYVQTSTGKEIRTADLYCKMWPVTEDLHQKFNKKNDWEIRLDICKAQREAMEQRDPAQAARLRYNNNAYDKELAKQLLPYIGVGFDIQPRDLAPEETSTTEVSPMGDDDDLPF